MTWMKRSSEAPGDRVSGSIPSTVTPLEQSPSWSLAHSLARPTRTDEEELMDGPTATRQEKRGALRDLRRANRFTGGHALTLRALSRLTSGMREGRPFNVLDVATGGGDFPREISRWAIDRGYRPEVLATDRDPQMLEIAAADGRVGRPADQHDGVRYDRADALQLPYADAAFDVATCSLFLHHLGPAEAVRLLAELFRVTRRGVVVNDLVRSWVGYLGAAAFTRVTSKNRLFRYDGPLSVRKAYTRAEMRVLAREAGCPEPLFETIPGYRLAMTIPHPRTGPVRT